MKQYDKIYVPNEMLGAFEACDIRSGNPERGRLYKEENVIVLTLEELKELWESASTMPALPGVFELYFKSKGIEL